MLRAFKYRLYPNEEQIIKFHKHFGACRYIYNWGLEHKIRTYKEDGKSISRFALNKEITKLKQSIKWLHEVNSQSLQGATLNLDNAFTNFFREKSGFPRFKSKKNPVQSFNVPQNYKVDFENSKVYLPRVGWIKTKIHRRFEGKLQTATISKTNTGKYYISILIDDGKSIPDKQIFNESNTLGVDLGISNFSITSDGFKVANPRYLKQNLRKLKREQRKLSRKQKGSKNREKQRLKVARIHEKIRNIREDFQHKLSTRLICENQAICLETLNIQGMLKNHHLAQHISDVGWYSFIEKLKYKAEWYGKTVLQIGQFEPSSKICNKCGYHNTELELKHRIWTCPECGTVHDRDINAAINIKDFALDYQNLIGNENFQISISKTKILNVP
ncbi:MAG: IS200/IS605 family element RNA-guided endonuclease TnpB [Methanobacterium sp.]